MSVRSFHGVVLALFAIAGCTSVPSKPVTEFAYAMPKRIDICHGYGCTYRAKLDLGPKDGQKFKAILSQGARRLRRSARRSRRQCATTRNGPIR